MKLIFFAVFILFATTVRAEIGYVYEGDLNGDGIEDRLSSGPEYMFGSGGGPFLISLSQDDGTFITGVIGLHPAFSALERVQGKQRIWGIWHTSAYQATLSSISLDGKFTVAKVPLYFNDKNALGEKITSVIFSQENKIKFQLIQNYVVPKHPTSEWGK